MRIDLSEWMKDLQTRRQSTIRVPVSVRATHERHLGPRNEYAQVELIAEPADAWDVEIALREEDRLEMERDAWLRECILGVLDVLVTRPPDPLLRIHLKVVAAGYSFESSRRAFRMAGRKAAEALLQAGELMP